jgi:hypothetical protein
MLTIVWNPHWFHLIKFLEKGRKFNARYDIDEILETLSQWRSIESAGNARKLPGMQTMRARIPPSHQLNILARIE